MGGGKARHFGSRLDWAPYSRLRAATAPQGPPFQMKMGAKVGGRGGRGDFHLHPQRLAVSLGFSRTRAVDWTSKRPLRDWQDKPQLKPQPRVTGYPLVPNPL